MMMMTKNTIYLAAAASLVLLAACTRQDGVPETSYVIRFASPVQTKATDAVANTDVYQIRDWYNDSQYHIDNTLVWNPSGSKWEYGTNATYEWTGGNHLFFSWLDHSDSYSTTAFFGTGLSTSGNTLTLPAKALTTSTAQYDFMYSNPVSRSTSSNDYSDVPLVFNHLFAQVAISFQISNQTPDGEQPIFLHGVYLNDNFLNSKETTITFNPEGAAEVSFSNSTHAGAFSSRTDFGGMSYGKGATPIDVLSQRQIASKDFYYFWPAEHSELEEVIDVVYRIATEPDIRTSRLSFPKGTKWLGGHKYSYTVTYMGGIFKVEDTVMDWNYTELSGSAEEQSAMASWIGWDSSSCTVSGRNVSFKTDEHGRLMDIHGMFKIHSPTQCTYHINLTQNANYYTITPNDGSNIHVGMGSIGYSSGDINPGVTIDFYISADDDDRPAAGNPPITAGLSFSVQASGGRDFSLDSELQRDGQFNIIIPSM